MFKHIFLLIVALGMSSIANAEWHNSEIKDQMRGRTTRVFSLIEKPIAGNGPSVTLTVLDEGNGRPGAVFRVNESHLSNCPSRDGGFCEASVKFESGSVITPNFASDDGISIIPTKSVAFVGAITQSKTIFFEIDIQGFGVRQYKFDVDGLDVRVDRSPIVHVHGFELGGSYPGTKAGLREEKIEGDKTCYEVNDQGNVLGSSRAKKASLCFYRDVFYLALVTPGTKSAYDAGKSYLTSVFGKSEPDSLYPSWPDSGDKVIERNTKSAAYLTLRKNSYDDLFIISDEVVSPLVPESVKK